jgi:transcriptional regulator GlxA family with amidase domain
VFWPSATASPAPIGALLQVIHMCSHEPGTSPPFVLERLLESLIIMVLSTVAVPREALGIARANRHPQLQRVLDAMHRDPGRRWTVLSLAAVAGLSRSAFAELFHREVGQSPARYLLSYRLALAARLKRQMGISTEQIARQCGYRSTAAFRRRFRRSTPDGA